MLRPRSARKKRGTADRQAQFAICVCNDDYPASLELRKLYQVVEDDFAQQHALLRVIDESGEDYLYPRKYFVRVALPKPVEQTLHRELREQRQAGTRHRNTAIIARSSRSSSR